LDLAGAEGCLAAGGLARTDAETAIAKARPTERGELCAVWRR
jgi:hypothetical protein